MVELRHGCARGLQTAPYPETYLSSLQLDWVNVHLLIRSALPPGQLVKSVKAAIQSSNSDQAVFGVMSRDELIEDAVTEPRFHVFLIGAFALLAVAMVAAGNNDSLLQRDMRKRKNN